MKLMISSRLNFATFCVAVSLYEVYILDLIDCFVFDTIIGFIWDVAFFSE